MLLGLQPGNLKRCCQKLWALGKPKGIASHPSNYRELLTITMTLSSLHWITPQTTPGESGWPGQGTHWSLWLMSLAYAMWRSCPAYVTTDPPDMNNSFRLASSPQALMSLKWYLHLWCWMTISLKIWSARPQDSNTIQSFKASPIECSPIVFQYVSLPFTYVHMVTHITESLQTVPESNSPMERSHSQDAKWDCQSTWGSHSRRWSYGYFLSGLPTARS